MRPLSRVLWIVARIVDIRAGTGRRNFSAIDVARLRECEHRALSTREIRELSRHELDQAASVRRRGSRRIVAGGAAGNGASRDQYRRDQDCQRGQQFPVFRDDPPPPDPQRDGPRPS